MANSHFTKSAVASQNKHFRALCAIESRKNSIDGYLDLRPSCSTLAAKQTIHKYQSLANIGRLDNKYISCPTTYKTLQKQLKTDGKTSDHLSKIFKNYLLPEPLPKTGLFGEYINKMSSISLQMRQTEYKNRLQHEIADKINSGWFCVFNTLTLHPKHYTSFYAAKSKVWQSYIKTITRAVQAKRYGSKRLAEQAGFTSNKAHTYFSVAEYGTKTGRLHFHTIHLMKYLPVGILDPNSGRAIPNYREINKFKTYWKLGFSSPIAARFSPSDAYGRIGWRWPSDRKNNSIKAKLPVQLASYVAKYINKAYGAHNTQLINGAQRWRIKMSRNFGLTPMIQPLLKLTLPQLRKIAMNLPHSRILTLNQVKILPRLLRRVAMRIYLIKLWQSKRRKSWALILKIKSAPSFSERFMTLTQKKLNLNSSNTTLTTTLNYQNTDTFKHEYYQTLVRAGFTLGTNLIYPLSASSSYNVFNH